MIITLLRENACAVLVSVSSYSFQISGAVLLLLWSLRKYDSKIKEQCLHSSDYLCGNFDETGIYINIPKDNLQMAAKNIYKNILAFLDILIGYICAIFSENIPLPRWSIFLFVISATFLILLFENVITRLIAKRRYPVDERVYEQKN